MLLPSPDYISSQPWYSSDLLSFSRTGIPPSAPCSHHYSGCQHCCTCLHSPLLCWQDSRQEFSWQGLQNPDSRVTCQNWHGEDCDGRQSWGKTDPKLFVMFMAKNSIQLMQYYEYLICKTAAEKPGIRIWVLEPSRRKKTNVKKAKMHLHRSIKKLLYLVAKAITGKSLPTLRM